MGLRCNSNSTHFRLISHVQTSLKVFQLFIFPSYVTNKSVQKYTIKENKNEIQQNNNNNNINEIILEIALKKKTICLEIEVESEKGKEFSMQYKSNLKT